MLCQAVNQAVLISRAMIFVFGAAALGEEQEDMRKLKEDARRVLKPDSALLAVIESDPDVLPKAVADKKILAYLKLLYKEQGRR